MKRLAILGASGHGKVVADIAEQLGWDQIHFFDDAWPNYSPDFRWEIIGNTEELLSQAESYQGVFIAIGNNSIRLTKLTELNKVGANIVSLVHPLAIISRYATIGLGTVIMPGVIINTDVSIGVGTIVNTGVTVDHDCMVGDAVHLSPGVNLSGGVIVSDRAWLGVGACVRQSITVGFNSVVGAGAVVVSNVDDNVTVIGNPARILNRN